MFKPRFLTLTGIVFSAALFRLLPHPWNFTPLAALSLFSGAKFKDKWQAFLVPLAAVCLSDLFLGFYRFWPLVYMAHAAVVMIGLGLQNRKGVTPLFISSVSASVVFFILSNLAHFFSSGQYPISAYGLAECYTAAIPFFRNTLLGDLFYSGVLFGGFKLAEFRFPVLRLNILATN